MTKAHVADIHASQSQPIASHETLPECLLQDGGDPLPVKKKKMAIIMPTINAIQAIWVAVPAIPEKPRTPAIIAMMRNVTAQLIMCFLLML